MASLSSARCSPACASSRKGYAGLLRMLCQASTVDWIAIGVLLIAAPALGSDAARRWIIAVAVIVYGYAAIGDALATRGRHIGWVLMTCAVAFALVGL